MAEFTLSIKTEDAAELRGIVDRIAGVGPQIVSVLSPAVGSEQPADQEHPSAGEDGLVTVNNGTVTQGDGEVTIAAATPERDKHGIKRDERIHANAAEPFKADGTWKRRKNLTDDQYDEVYLDLVREAQAAGVYAGPVVPELELESKVVDTTQAAAAPAPAPVAAAPSPQAAPAPTPGMSAQATPTPNAVVMKLMPLAGPAAFPALFSALGVASIMAFSPEQLRLADEVATALRERVESEGALVTNAAGAVSSSPEWKAANPNALIETAQLFGLV